MLMNMRELRRSPPVARAATPAQNTFRRIENDEFLEMSRTYDAHGGIATGDQIATDLGGHRDQPIAVVARWIIGREVVNFAWRSGILVPRFQFSALDMEIRPVVSRAIAELQGAFDDWEIARWFTQPNTGLRNALPLDLLAEDEAAVIEAARADRYVACA
jgi:hypothetical protein